MKMEIKEADFSDIPRIVELLKASLGDELPVSEAIWKYKHHENPFGKSIVLLAEENGKLAGVRAFMRWKWQKGDEIYSCLRAVDTATHPDFRGRGIFKQLTLNAVEVAKDEGAHFVFNTPNDQSRPGYLKMGWEISGRIKVGIRPSWNSFWKLSEPTQDFHTSYISSQEELEALSADWNSALRSDLKLFTPKSPEYLNWRYEKNPLQSYEVFSGDEIYLAASVKMRGRLKELRIVECISLDRKRSLKQINRRVRKWSSRFGVQVVSFSPAAFPGRKFTITGSFGPLLTTRDLNLLISRIPEISNVEDWAYSLGDLELF